MLENTLLCYLTWDFQQVRSDLEIYWWKPVSFYFQIPKYNVSKVQKTTQWTHKQWKCLLRQFRLDTNQNWYQVVIRRRSSTFKLYLSNYHFRAQRTRRKGCEHSPPVANPPGHFFCSANLTPYALCMDNKVQEFPGRNDVPLNWKL